MTALLGVGAATVLLVLRPPFWAVRLAAVALPDVVFFGATDGRLVALSLDDGPHPSTTPAVLELLARHRARATFFLLGSAAQREPQLVRRIVSEGHEVGNHTWQDEPSHRMSGGRLDWSVASTQRLLTAVTTVRLFRPGSGWVTRRVLRTAERHGLRCVLGSVYPHDAHIRWRRYVVWEVLRRARPGAIIILHEGDGRTAIVDVLKALLPDLRERGYRVTTVSEILRRSG